MGYGGGGGFVGVLLGLFILAIGLCLRVLFWALVLTCLVIRQSYRGIRWLYRRHQEKKGITPKDTRKLPEPYMSPVEYRRNSRS